MTLGPFLGFLCYVLGTKLGGVLLFRMCFEKGVWLFVSCFGGCLIAAAPQQHHSSSSSHQQQHQQQAAAGSSRQAAAGSRRQLQAAAGSSRHQQRQRQAAAKFQFYSMVSEVTLGPFLALLCYVLDMKLGGVLLFRMCFEKGVWLFVSCFGGCLIAAAPQQHHSSSSSHQQQHQQQAAAGSSRQAAAGSRRQLQAAAGSSRQQQRQQQAAAGSGKVSILQYGFRNDIRVTFWQPAAAVALFLTRSRRDVNI